MTEYAFNPLTGNLDRIGETDGPGGSVTINTGDGGSITATDFFLDYQGVFDTDIGTTVSADGDTLIVNNVWSTPYVVDSNTTLGLQGSYATIQDAIDQAAIDYVDQEAKLNPYILVRLGANLGVYSDPISFPANIPFFIEGISYENDQVFGFTSITIEGQITAPEDSSYMFKNVYVFSDGSTILKGNKKFYGCYLNNINTDYQQSWFNNSIIASANLAGTSINYIRNCHLQSLTLSDGSSTFIDDCGDSNSQTVIFVSDTARFCINNTSGITSISGSSSVLFVPCQLHNVSFNGLSSECVDFEGPLFYSNLNIDITQASDKLFTSNSTPTLSPSTLGNLFNIKEITGDYTLTKNDQAIAIGTRSATIEITLPLTSGTPTRPYTTQQFVFVDKAGLNSTYPVTLTPNGGTINGQSSLVMDQDYQSLTIYFDGTDYFTLSNTNSGSSSASAPPIGALEYFANANGDAYLDPDWLLLDGSVLTQTDYPILFSRMGLINPGGTLWTARTSGTLSNINGLTFGNGLYLMAGDGGMLRSSTDGITWTGRVGGTALPIFSLAYDGTKYYYGGVSGTFGTSTDSITWSTKSPSLGYAANPSASANYGPFLTYGAGKLVGLAQPNSNGLTSTDGLTWTTFDLGVSTSGGGLIFAGGKFVYVGTGTVKTSTDAITWINQTSPVAGNISFINFTNSLYLIGTPTGGIYSSTDAVTWVSRPTGMTGQITWSDFGNGVYVAFNSAGAAKTSTDLITWNTVTPTLTAWAGLFNGTIFVSAGAAGALKTSTDGVTWTTRTSNTTSTIDTLVYQNSLHIYGGVQGALGTSTDGITWTARTSGTSSNITAIQYDGALWHAGGNGFSLSSIDAVTWVLNPNVGTTSTINSIIYAGGQYVYSTQGGGVATSTDAITWVQRTSGMANISGLAYGGVYIAGGISGALSSSTDAITWTPRTTGLTFTINAVTYTNSLYLAGANTGQLASSTDAITWNVRNSNVTGTISSFAFANGITLLAGNGTALATSTDNITWNPKFNASGVSNLNAAIGGDSVFVAGSNIGAIETSPITYTYNPATQFQLPVDAQLGITNQVIANFPRGLYIKAL